MADIFVSYARGEKARVAPLVAALEAQGWSVWWDPAITPGQEFDPLIRREIEAAQAVIVVWTPLSVESRWVRGEAQLGAERGILVPVRFDKARLPIDALALHTTDLDDWKGDERSAPFQELLRALGAWLKTAPRAAPAAKPRIAILPFENLSPDPANAFFTDGLHEEILSTLANSAPGLEVISRTTMASYKGRAVTVAEVAEK
ncbi:MAG TPA: TIR domain-containing protein, partial [Alphaproteobacteria bacterium]|nr:TIR domain-containing protein [Alphaproteobacteria bacterium]